MGAPPPGGCTTCGTGTWRMPSPPGMATTGRPSGGSWSGSSTISSGPRTGDHGPPPPVGRRGRTGAGRGDRACSGSSLGGAMKRLSGTDAAFLYMETPSSHMHVAGIGVYDPATAPEPLTRDRMIEVTGERLHLAPLFRQRLPTIPFGLHHPLWVDDPDYDLEYHIRSATLPAPG